MPTLPIPSPAAPSSAVAEFIDKLKGAGNATVPASGSGRLIFALDATASREPTWDKASHIQHAMFEATAGLGVLSCQLVYFRGFNECKASRWVTTAGELQRLMRTVRCDAGITQIGRVLDHAIREATTHPVGAVVLVGDAVEEPIDRLAYLAATLGTPIFLLHEAPIRTQRKPFGSSPPRPHGAYLPFDLASIDRLKELLAAIAVYATGGYAALEKHAAGKPVMLQITSQLRRR